MNARSNRLYALLGVLISFLSTTNSATACTGIRLTAKDGAVVHARTMEFSTQLHSDAIIIPRHLPLRGTTRTGKPGLGWETKYAAVGMNGLGQPLIVDGVNEKGLAGGIFYLPGYAQYEEVAAGEESRSLAPWELLTWLLTNFGTVEEVRAALPGIRVGNVVFDGLITPPVHYIIHDASGNSLVVEYIGGKLAMHDDPIGVITNAPDFEWHVKNLNNYVNLTALNAPPVSLDGLKLSQFGQGSGLLGVPGDYTPPSRFVRAAVLSGAAVPGEDGEQTVQQAFHILDSFDIPKGVVRGDDNGPSSFEVTQWTTASDTKNLVFYFHTLDNRRIRRIDLSKADLNAKEIVTIPVAGREDYQDLTPARASK